MCSSYGRILKNISYFKSASSDILGAICTRLIPQPFCPHEIIYRQHAHGNGMYLLLSGDARAYYENASENDIKVYTKVSDGDVFRCILIFEGRRIMTVETVSYCQTFCLKTKLFRQVLSMYHPVFASSVKRSIVKTLWKSLLTSPKFLELSTNQSFLSNKRESPSEKIFDKWYMVTRKSRLSRMLAMMEGSKSTQVEESNKRGKNDQKNIQLHSVLQHGSSSDAMLSTVLFLMQQQQQQQ